MHFVLFSAARGLIPGTLSHADPTGGSARSRLLTGLLLGGALLTPWGATAQTRPSAPSAAETPAAARAKAASGEVVLDPVVVEGHGTGPQLTRRSGAGSRLGLSVQETPASVELVDGEALRRTNAQDLNRALVENSVGLSFNGGHGSGGNTLTMRGFSGHNSITRLYDGIRLLPAAASVTFPFDSWTIERVEVLHGPAAVLHGSGGIGGAINFIPKRPDGDTRRREIRTTLGSHGLRGLAFGSAGPITPRLAYSLDGNLTAGGGERPGPLQRSYAVSGALRWQATEDLQVTASLDLGDNRPDTYFGTPLVNGKIDPATRWNSYNARDAEIRYRDKLAQVRLDWALAEGVTVRNTLYHLRSDRRWRNIENARYDPVTGMVQLSDYIAVHHDQQQWGNRLEGIFEGELGGIAHRTAIGLELNRIRFRNFNNSPYATPGDAQWIVDLLRPGSVGFGTHVMALGTDTTTKRGALFADTRLVLSDQLSLVAGFNLDRTDFTNHGRGYGGAFNGVNGRIGAVWTPRSDVSVYGQVSYAEESLGNLLTQSVANVAQLPTTARQAEIGVKLALPDGRGEATLAAYHIERGNILSSDPDDRSKTLQIGQMSSRGVEAALAYQLAPGLRLNANAALIRARYDDFWSGTTDFSGNRVPNMPNRVANLQAVWDITPDWQLRGGVHHVSAAYTNNQNTVQRPSYTVLNAGLQWAATETAVLDLSVTNLTDKVYANGGGSSKLVLAPGRALTLSAHLRF